MTNRLGRRFTAGMLALILCTPAAARADDPSSPAAIRADPPPPFDSGAHALAHGALSERGPQASRTALHEAIRRSLPKLMQEDPPATSIRAQGSYGRITRNRHARLKRDIGMIVGVVGGLYAGAYLGAKIEGDSCRCDDPGFQGGLIGALTGAVLGGIAGAAIGSR